MANTGFERPTLAQLVERIRDDFNLFVPGGDSRVKTSILWVLALVIAGVFHTLYGFQSFVAANLIPDRSTGEVLARWAGVFGLTRTAATKAAGSVTFTGINGSTIPAGTQTQRADGIIYATDGASAIPPALTVDVPSTAVEFGADGNAAGGVLLALVAPVTGVDSGATVEAAGILGGNNLEDDDSLRARVLERLQTPPQGGAAADYVAWTRAALSTADRVFVVGGAGTVAVSFTVDQDGAPTTVIPSAGDVATVDAYIQPLRPVTAIVTVAAPVALEVTMSITLTPNTAAVQAAVEAELDALYQRRAEPNGTIYNSELREAIGAAAGESHHELNVVLGGSGLDDVVQTSTEVAVRGLITWLP